MSITTDVEAPLKSDETIRRLQSLGVVIEPSFRLPQTFVAEPPVVIAKVRFDRQLKIGAYSYIGQGSEIRGAEIGRFCSIARRVIMAQAEHPTGFVSSHPLAFNPASGFSDDEYFASVAVRRQVEVASGVTIGHDVWIGDGAIIRTGLSIGTGAIIGAGAVVVKDVAPYAIVGGVPARVIRMRFDEATVERLLASAWWTRDIRTLRDLMASPPAFLDAFEAARDELPFLRIAAVEVRKQPDGRYYLKVEAPSA